MQTGRATAVLARATGLPASALQRLMELAGGDPADAITAPRLRTLEPTALPDAARQALLSPDLAAIEADLAWLKDSGAQILLCTDPRYPPLLAQVDSAPAALYVLGDPAVLQEAQLAVVGSRNPTPLGYDTARDFCAWFARAGLVVTSGLALGIDAAAHIGALRGDGVTIAVFGTGLDRVYPAEHGALAARIRERGALVAELPPRTAPLRHHFPLRNRIIAGLSLGTLVVEAARRSGSLITARLAGEQGRDVFAIPGSIHSPLSRGCNQLIRDGAHLVTEAADVLRVLQIPLPQERVRSAQQPAPALAELDKEYEMLLDALDFAPAAIDTLVARTQLPGESVASMLLILELQGHVAALPGGRYARKHP
ncbi:MAG: DNA-protecting protein DprA [Proteobacteria bacterium]|nr:DNA-protecting protein DprA [Pseudomonadota bacterium]